MVKTGRIEKKVSEEARILKLLRTKEPYYEAYYNSLRASSKITSFKTCTVYVNIVLKFFKDTGSQPDKVTLDDINNYMIKISAFSGDYQVEIYSALKRFFEYMVASKRILYNPMDAIEKPQRTKEENKNRYCLTQEETLQFLEKVKTGTGNSSALKKQEKWRKRDLAIMGVFLTTGLRCGALIDINEDNVDLEKGNLRVVEKGDKYFDYDLSPSVVTLIKDWIEDKHQKVSDNKYPEALFISNRLKRISYIAVKTLVEKYSNDITDKHITPHKLRATFATTVYESTRDIYLTQKAMHHVRPETTEIYIRPDESVTKETGQLTSEVFKI